MSKHKPTAWDALTETQKRRVVLRLRGWTLAEIAEAEGVSHQAVAQTIQRAEKTVGAIADVVYHNGDRRKR